MVLFKKNVSAIGMGQVISEAFMESFPNRFDRIMAHLGVSSDQYNQFHA